MKPAPFLGLVGVILVGATTLMVACGTDEDPPSDEPSCCGEANSDDEWITTTDPLTGRVFDCFLAYTHGRGSTYDNNTSMFCYEPNEAP